MAQTPQSKVAKIFNDYVTGDLVRLVRDNGPDDLGYKYLVVENPDNSDHFWLYSSKCPESHRSAGLWEDVIHDGQFVTNIKKGADARVNTAQRRKGDSISMVFFKSKSTANRFLRSQKDCCDLSIGVAELEVIPPRKAFVIPKAA